ncbi:hypothetical protein D7X33_20680 [Butyricicoccus sp. 1XD8-22]|nr:hypothetical protein D7X33_20680 [Butyricicoccus sp. 1XD8-22]
MIASAAGAMGRCPLDPRPYAGSARGARPSGLPFVACGRDAGDLEQLFESGYWFYCAEKASPSGLPFHVFTNR